MQPAKLQMLHCLLADLLSYCNILPASADCSDMAVHGRFAHAGTAVCDLTATASATATPPTSLSTCATYLLLQGLAGGLMLCGHESPCLVTVSTTTCRRHTGTATVQQQHSISSNSRAAQAQAATERLLQGRYTTKNTVLATDWVVPLLQE